MLKGLLVLRPAIFFMTIAKGESILMPPVLETHSLGSLDYAFFPDTTEKTALKYVMQACSVMAPQILSGKHLCAHSSFLTD